MKNKSKVPLIGSWLAHEVIGVPTRLSSGLSLLPHYLPTFLVSSLSCWTKYLSNVSFLSPAIFSQVLSSSLCLVYAAIPPTR